MYFGIDATKFLIGVAVAVTILIGKPLLSWAIPKAVRLPQELLVDPRYTRTMANASWVIVFYEVLSAIWDVWLFNNSGFNLFFLARSGTNFVFAFICITGTLLYVDGKLKPIESYPGLEKMLESAGPLVTHGPLVVLHDHLDGGVRPSTVPTSVTRSVSPHRPTMPRRSGSG